MKIDILGVQAFVAIAEHGGFGKAADFLRITQTALTRRLQGLEALLDVKLFERTTRSVSLTSIGGDFLPRAHRLLSELETSLAAIRETGKTQRGDVTLACVPTIGVQFLPRIIRDYAARFPENRIRILDHSSAGVAGAVVRREAEFGINIRSSMYSDLSSMPLVDDRYVLICRHDHPLASNKKLAWKEVEPFPLIFAGESSSNRPLLDAALAGKGVLLRTYYEVQRSSTAVGLVAEGVAAAIVPGLALQKGTYPSIRVIPLIEPVVSRSIVLLSRKSAQLSPAAQALYSLLLKSAKGK
ncbi:MAG TPA: LysR family transcriptional regulator [Steroidobacteraceae bacterium]|jgi:DNA-binding transcriptional LysR family regulator